MGHKHTSFPLTYLFDDSPATAWVFSGTGKHVENGRTGFALALSREEKWKPVTADSIWIMNGYNKTPELFLRNNRITEIKLDVNWKPEKTVVMADSMGWHKISIPRQPIREVALRFTKFEKGTDDDVCVSEIALYDRGKKVDLKMPKVVEFTEGDGDCGCGQVFSLIDRSGKQLVSYDFESPCVWSPSRRYVASGGNGLWVVDASAGKIIMRRSLPGWTDITRWHGDDSLELTVSKSDNDFRTKTIRIRHK